MSFTAEHLAALEAALASGELTVSYEGKSVTYQSFKDLEARLNYVRAQLRGSGALSSTPRSSLTAFSKD